VLVLGTEGLGTSEGGNFGTISVVVISAVAPAIAGFPSQFAAKTRVVQRLIDPQPAQYRGAGKYRGEG
jgi:hypothetical protein